MVAVNPIRDRILSHGLGIASQQGLHALSMGTLARELDLPRSGLTSHFADVESLQLGVLEQAATLFQREVIEATAALPAGEPRLEALFAKWIQWSRSPKLKGGCPFVHASRQASALPEPVRSRLAQFLDGWSALLTQAVVDAKQAGQMRADIEPEQTVFELHGLYLGHHFFHWYQKDRLAEQRTMKAFERLLAACR
jgi:AcrR family transcriptional regulator